MTTKNQMTRRRFLGSLIVLTISVSGFFHKSTQAQQIYHPQLHHFGLALVNASFQNSNNAMQLGVAYMRRFPKERNLTSLLDVILERNPSLLNILGKNKNNDLMLSLQQMVSKDFENGDTINIDGWIVAKTEARLSALAKFV